MKQSTIPSLSFYLYIVICFAGSFARVDASSEITTLKDQQNLEIFTTLRIIKRMHREVHEKNDELPPEDQEQQESVNNIMVILVGMYEKIVAATVTHYLLMNTPGQQDLQFVVARIIAEDAIKIIAILGKQLLRFIFSQSMTLKEKIWYCAWVAGIVIIIKLGIDQIPKVKNDKKDENKKPENNLLLQFPIPDSIMEEKPSGFSQFHSYRPRK